MQAPPIKKRQQQQRQQQREKPRPFSSTVFAYKYFLTIMSAVAVAVATTTTTTTTTRRAMTMARMLGQRRDSLLFVEGTTAIANPSSSFLLPSSSSSSQSSTIYYFSSSFANNNNTNYYNNNVQVLVETLHGGTMVVNLPMELFLSSDSNNESDDSTTTTTNEINYEMLLRYVLQAVRNNKDLNYANDDDEKIDFVSNNKNINKNKNVVLLHNGKIIDKYNFPSKALLDQIQYQLLAKSTPKTTNIGTATSSIFIQLKCLGRGGMDRQNRVGSKFGGGGVSSSQQSERERKERLKQLALESIDLAKDPYLMRNHLGTYECKLCLTLHTNEANYLSHTQGKKHQQGLARRAHLEKLKQEREQQQQQQQQQLGNMSDRYGPGGTNQQQLEQQKAKKIRIGRPAYQVFKSRDNVTNQRCLSFELHYPEIAADLQPRHRFMSAYEQKIDVPPNRNYQYLLFAAEPYETVAFKIPNEPIDKDIDKFVTHWDEDDKKFTLTLYFLEQQQEKEEEQEQGEEGKTNEGTTNETTTTTTTTTVATSDTTAEGLGTVTVS